MTPFGLIQDVQEVLREHVEDGRPVPYDLVVAFHDALGVRLPLPPCTGGAA